MGEVGSVSCHTSEGFHLVVEFSGGHAGHVGHGAHAGRPSVTVDQTASLIPVRTTLSEHREREKDRDRERQRDRPRERDSTCSAVGKGSGLNEPGKEGTMSIQPERMLL